MTKLFELVQSDLISAELPDVGDPIQLDFPGRTRRATWLGTVSNGRELAAAMRLMAKLDDERCAAEAEQKMEV